jgi:hypothetical protein
MTENENCRGSLPLKQGVGVEFFPEKLHVHPLLQFKARGGHGKFQEKLLVHPLLPFIGSEPIQFSFSVIL